VRDGSFPLNDAVSSIDREAGRNTLADDSLAIELLDCL
jgi:hypothetical protein